MENRYLEFTALQRQVEALLKEDDIETALLSIFDFLETNQPYIESPIPQSRAIGIAASAARLKKAFNNGIIAWESTYRIRSGLVEECLNILEYLRRDIEESGYERRDYPHIGSFPHLFVVGSSLERIESLLVPYVRY